jgi:hypothetical protein
MRRPTRGNTQHDSAMQEEICRRAFLLIQLAVIELKQNNKAVLRISLLLF